MEYFKGKKLDMKHKDVKELLNFQNFPLSISFSTIKRWFTSNIIFIASDKVSIRNILVGMKEKKISQEVFITWNEWRSSQA